MLRKSRGFGSVFWFRAVSAAVSGAKSSNQHFTSSESSELFPLFAKRSTSVLTGAQMLMFTSQEVLGRRGISWTFKVRPESLLRGSGGMCKYKKQYFSRFSLKGTWMGVTKYCKCSVAYFKVKLRLNFLLCGSPPRSLVHMPAQDGCRFFPYLNINSLIPGTSPMLQVSRWPFSSKRLLTLEN